MSTIKFTVEIDEQYVRDHANPERMAEMAEDGSKEDLMSIFADILAFSALKNDMEKGITEFSINSGTFGPEVNSNFEGVLTRLATMAHITNKDKGEEKEE